LSTPNQRPDAEGLSNRLGALSAGVFAEAAMHTPVDVTELASATFKASGADCVVSLGGGSTTGLGKAIATRTGADQIVIPTTYAGSEMTDILGETKSGEKTTRRDPSILPETVIYDVDLTLTLPQALRVTSGLNAMAHAAEAIYAPDRNPIISLIAAEATRALCDALPGIVRATDDREARASALYGAWLCGAALGGASMALHHKLCHTLGGAFDTPHAENARHCVAAHGRLQRGGGVRAARAHFTSARRNARHRAVRLRRIARRANKAQGSRIDGGRSRSDGCNGYQESVLESAAIRRGGDTRAFARRVGRKTSAAMSRGPHEPRDNRRRASPRLRVHSRLVGCHGTA
jgi:Iron-containing alcohol dehydrogenase